LTFLDLESIMYLTSFVSNAMAQCTSAEQFATVKMSLHALVARAVAAGDLATRDWAEVHLPSIESSMPTSASPTGANVADPPKGTVESAATIALPPKIKNQEYMKNNDVPSPIRDASYRQSFSPGSKLPLSPQEEAPPYVTPPVHPNSMNASSTLMHFEPPCSAVKPGKELISASPLCTEVESSGGSSKREGKQLDRKARKNSVTLSSAEAAKLIECHEKQCSLCDIRCSDLKAFEEHLKSRVHQKYRILQRKGIQIDGTTGRATLTASFQCALCNVDCGSSKGLKQHLKAKKHTKMVHSKAKKHMDNAMLQNQVNILSGTSIKAPENALSSLGATSAEMTATKTVLEAHNLVSDSSKEIISPIGASLMPPNVGLEMQSIPDTTITPWGGDRKKKERNTSKPIKTGSGGTNTTQAMIKFRCDLCNKNCPNARHLQNHLKGKKHIRNVSLTSGKVVNQTAPANLARPPPPPPPTQHPPLPPLLAPEWLSFNIAPPLPPPLPPVPEWVALNTSPPPPPPQSPPPPPPPPPLPPAPERVPLDVGKPTALMELRMKKVGAQDTCSTNSDMSIDDDSVDVERNSVSRNPEAREAKKYEAVGDTRESSTTISHPRSRSPTRKYSRWDQLPSPSRYASSNYQGRDFRQNRSRSPPYSYHRRHDSPPYSYHRRHDSPPNWYRRRSRSPQYRDRSRWNTGRDWS